FVTTPGSLRSTASICSLREGPAGTHQLSHADAVASGARMRLVRIYSKQSGESAIELREVPMSAGARPTSPTFQGGALFFRETPEGHVQDLHNAPRRQLIFLASGLLEIESSEGARHLCRP